MKSTSQSSIHAARQWSRNIALAASLALWHQDASAAQVAVDLGTASRFAILAASEITSVPTCVIQGDVGLSPSARSRIAGLTPVEVRGTIYAADDGGAVAVMLTQAHGDLTVAYNDAAGRIPVPTGEFLNPGGANLGGLSLVPGLYKFTGGALISGSDLTLTGGASDVWIFQVGSSLTVADGIHVVLTGGAQAANIFWQVGTSATLGTGVAFKGTILADQSIALHTLTALDGRALARIAAVTLESNTITVPDTIVLVSAPVLTGPYTYAAGQVVDALSRTITVPMSGGMQFYRVSSTAAVLITGIKISGGHVVITCNNFRAR